ncbi:MULTISPECIES: hemin uptake protein HemP [Arcobacter]|jgi:hemin uptake protein HemP|uniref:Hemin uptake protein HemP n=1 Tax=Arcobacter ellisii TaxID=913109 RepID=A0A347U6S2_9BACT|nr:MULTISPECIES: hemin uptake protein HemP [Arcobacter]MDX9814885.1 hemin uptake protein HemP [Sulfurimonadaceae bacterium]AXX94550.1 hemin uptake protein HemP [Arcobacter ellisii]MBD3830419.1 hemin uptake protein HemP [Arcobacter sp.]MDD3009128.1 hemin uptake protein HemP [Arcobacter sp.]MDY3203666.1 hemin uptake protein HemP [Arcobacter sp.]
MKEKKDKKIDSKEIFNQTNIITIVHDGQEYHLRITKANKLILTK